jgi:hypothetical protein
MLVESNVFFEIANSFLLLMKMYSEVMLPTTIKIKIFSKPPGLISPVGVNHRYAIALNKHSNIIK